MDSLPANLRPTHISLFDGTLQGLERTDKPAFCFQGHPEASPGPHDIATCSTASRARWRPSPHKEWFTERWAKKP
jgi:carbamoylphosphate synthase small subunit